MNCDRVSSFVSWFSLLELLICPREILQDELLMIIGYKIIISLTERRIPPLIRNALSLFPNFILNLDVFPKFQNPNCVWDIPGVSFKSEFLISHALKSFFIKSLRVYFSSTFSIARIAFPVPDISKFQSPKILSFWPFQRIFTLTRSSYGWVLTSFDSSKVCEFKFNRLTWERVGSVICIWWRMTFSRTLLSMMLKILAIVV